MMEGDIIENHTWWSMAKEKLSAHFGLKQTIAVTFEDGVGPYSQHAMIHMQTQFFDQYCFSWDGEGSYDEKLYNIGDFWIKRVFRGRFAGRNADQFNQDSAHLACLAEGGMIDEQFRL